MVTRRVAGLIGVLAVLVVACAGPAATPRPATPAPATPAAATPVPATPAPATPAPVTPEPATPEPVTPAPATPVANACEGESINFMLSFLANIQHAGFLIAAERGYYEEEGLDVTITPAGPGVDVATAVADGTADLGQIDYVPLVEAREVGVPIKSVGQIYKDPFFFWYSAGRRSCHPRGLGRRACRRDPGRRISGARCDADWR